MPDDRDHHKADVTATTAGGITTRVYAPLRGTTSSRPDCPDPAVPYGWKPTTGAFGVFLSTSSNSFQNEIPQWSLLG